LPIPEFQPVQPKYEENKDVNYRTQPQPIPIEQNKYYNKKLEQDLNAIKEDQKNTEAELELLKAGIDRNIFYELLRDWDYGGVRPFSAEES